MAMVESCINFKVSIFIKPLKIQDRATKKKTIRINFSALDIGPSLSSSLNKTLRPPGSSFISGGRAIFTK